jgi:hypothetical protein
MSTLRSPRCGIVSLMLLILCACATSPKNQAPPSPPPAGVAPVVDSSYDWHGLLQLPFGTGLKDSPFTLHEVLMFREAAQATRAAPGDDAECYALDQTAPRFLSRTPSDYLLCFRNDHLARVEATVHLPKEEAPRIFSDACGLWQKTAGATQAGAVQAGAAQAGAGQPAAVSPGAANSNACQGRDGAVAFSALLEENGDGTDSAVTLRLDAPAQP